jgi:hypothetical protein
MTRATSFSFTGSHANFLPTNSYQAITNLQQMIDKKQVIRILKPELIGQLQTAVSQHRMHPNILQFNDNFYISLKSIRDDSHRDRVFSLLRKMQIDDNIDLSAVSGSIRPLSSQSNPLAGSIALSVIIGIIFGALAMAIGVLIMTIAGTGTEATFGLQTKAVIFTVATVICWIISTVFIFARTKLAANNPR